MAESQLRTLYESLRRDNYDVPDTYESFERTLTAPGQEGTTNRQTLYNSLHKDGYDVPDTYESFANTLFVPQPKQQTAPAPQAVAEAPAPTQKTQTTAKDTAPVQKAQPQVQTQTRPTSQQPTGTVVAFKLRRGGHDFYVTQQEVNEAGGLGAWAAKHPGAPVRVYMHGDGFTGHVDLSEASKRRKEKGYKYTLEYRPGHKVKRNKSGWVDNLVEYGQETKAIEEMTAPTKQVVEQLWSAAEKKQTTDARNNYDALNNKWSRTGDDMPFVDSSVRYLANETDRMKNFDLDKMSEEAWRRSGAALTQKVYQRLKLANPKADDNKLIEQAEAEAWRLTNKTVYDYAVEKNMPKSVLEYFFKKVMDQNSVVSLLRGTARSMAATTGDQSAYEAAQEEYGKKHKVASVASTVVGMGADPMMTLTGGAGGAAGKAVLNVGGRLIARKAAGTAVETGTRLFANKLGAKVAAGVASGSVNLGMYEGLKEGERQFLHGGYINPETGQNEGYSLRAMFESAGKGAILGAATGVISPIFGNVGNKLVGKADRISSTGGSMAAKAGIRATQHLVATGLEGTIFATEGWLTTDEDKMDVWLDSMATMIGFKGHHIIKSAPRVIAGMRPVKPTADRPLTIDERNFNRKSFVERVSAMLDGPKFADERRNGSGMPLSFTKDDISTLKEAGYGSLADIFRSDRAKEADKPFEERVLDALGEDESTAEMSNGSGGLLDGYSEMEKLVKDASVPQEIRAKAYYALTGHCLGAGTITGHATRETDDGRIAVDALTNNGEIVYRRYYKSKDAANAATEKLDRQIELNKIDVGEQYADAVADETILDDIIKDQYPDSNPEDIKKIYYGVKYGKARADEHLQKGIDAIDKEIAARKDEAADMRPDVIRKDYGEEYGVDIDDAIRKPSGDRSEAEKEAVESYIARLFASGETRVDRYDGKSESYVSDVSDVTDAADVAETQPERQPIGRATMKFRDRPVEVLSGRVVMTEDGKMVDVERSDKTIVVRDPATGKTEMVSPEAMLSYEDVAPEVAADERSMPKYSSGRIVIRDADGKERRGFLTGDVDDQGRYEYYLAGDLNHLFYATEEELDNRVTKFVPDRRNDVADVSDVADEKQNEVSVSMPTGVEAIGAVDVAQSDGYGRRFTVGRNENGELVVVDERGYMWAHDGNGERMEPYQPGANVPVWTEEQLSNLGAVQLTNEQPVAVPNLPENVPTFTETSQNPTESAILSAETVPNPENHADNAKGAPNQTSELTPLQRIPRDEKGEPIFEQAETPEIAWDALVEFSDGDVADAKEMADIVTEQKRKALEKLQKQKPKGDSLAELRESQKVIKAAREQAEQEYNLWQRIAGIEQLRQEAEARRQAEERAEAERAEAEEKKRKAALDKRLRDTFEDVKDVPEAVEVLEDMDPRDIYEAAAQLLSGQKVLWGDAGVKVGARSETGFGEEERRRLFGLFASEANGGKSLSRLAEDAMKQQCETYGIPYDNQDARNALIDVISGARTVGDIRNYIANNRIDEARRLAEAKRRHEEEQYDEFCRQEYHLSAEEVEAYEDQLLAELSERDIEFDANEYNDYIADEMARAAEITEQQKNGTEDNDARRGSTPGDRRVQENDTEGKGTVSGRSDEVLPESRADQSSGAAADGDRSGIQSADGVQGDGPASAVAQGAQRGGIAAVGRRKADDSPYGGLAEEVTSAIGPFGKIYTQFRGKPREAVTFLLAKRDGEAIGALHHKDVGEIDLVWGEEGSAHSDGFGLAKLAKYHPEVLFNLQEILNDMAVTKRSANRVQLESEKYKAAVRLTWDNQKKTWLLTMFEKKNSVLDNTTDTDKTHEGNGNDTATPENTVISDRKDNDFASDKQASGEESLPQLSDDKRKPGLQAAVEAASAEVNTEPTEAQKKAGNYKKGHVTIGSFDITIENPAGSVRRGVDADGKEWSTTMANAYGEIRGTQSVDGDPIDVFLATDMDAWNGRKVFVVDQTNADGSFDEHKVMLGFNDKDEATAAYLANYNKTWADTHPGLRITEANIADFQKWVESSHRKTKAFADYSMVKGTAEAVARRQKDEAELRTERPERGANYDMLKSDLVGFAKKFKDAGTANITAIEREISEWMSKQTAEDIVDLDAWMLSDVCNEAGLDKGKAWAFRMSVDHATPKELIEEVFKIRNSRRAQIALRGIADVDGFDMLSPESQAAVEHYLSRYGSKPIRVVVGMDDIWAPGFPKEVSEAFEEVVDEGGIPAVYNHSDKKIYIFANVFNSARRHDGDLFHENVHGAIDECESYPEELLSSFRRKVVSSGYKAARFQGLESMLKKEYDEDSVDEEFLAYTLQWMFDRSDRESRIMELLSDEEKEFINNNILNKIRYAQRRRTSESASEESKGHETLHASRQRAGGGDGAWISRKATDGDEQRGSQGVAGESASDERSEQRRYAIGDGAAEAPAKGKNAESGGDETARIEDFGEKIVGARKDMLREVAKSVENVTEQSLIELPMGKAFKRPNLKKMVDGGVISDDDASLAEAVMQGLVYAKNKPVATRSPRRQREIKEWAKETYEGIRLLGEILSGDPARRDKALEERKARQAEKLAEVNRHIDNLREWNPGKEFSYLTELPDEVEVVSCVLKGIGHKVGEKINLPLCRLEVSSTGKGYTITGPGKQGALWFKKYHNTVDEAIETMIFAARLARGDRDVEIPGYYLSVKGVGRPRMERTGKYEVAYWAKNGKDIKTKLFSGKKEAEEFATAHSGKVTEQQRYVNEYESYTVTVKNPLTGNSLPIGGGSTERVELIAMMDEQHDELNALAVEAIAKETGTKSAPRDHFFVATTWERGKIIYSIVSTDKNNPWPIVKDFATRKEAEAWYGANRERLEAERRQRMESEKSVVYFETGVHRRGKDHRSGRHATPEMYDEQFGFRGVQFGNWTNDTDRQMAMDQAYDALMDLSEQLGISPRAMSLYGELGLAFGARGCGNASAHYEPVQIVINLTKTKGAGSLAHEWWHALDNYLSRRAGVALGHATHGHGSDKMDPDVASAVARLMEAVLSSQYGKRSLAKGEYWGRPTEMGARLFETWISERIKAEGNRSPFLVSGISQNAIDLFHSLNYLVYRSNEARVAEREKREPHYMSKEEFIKTPEALNGYPYPVIGELEALSPSLENLFNILRENERTDGMMAKEPRRRYGRAKRPTMTGRTLFDWADDEARAQRDTPAKDERDIAADDANAALDEYAEAYNDYLERTENLEAQLEAEGVDETLRAILREQADAEETMLLEGRDRLRESLRQYYVRENTPEDAERITRDMVSRLEAEIEVRRRGKSVLADILEERMPAEGTAQPTNEARTSQVKTAGGYLTYQAQGHLPDAREGEFAYVERQFSRTGEFSFTGSDRIIDRGDVAYIFRSLEDYSNENVFAVLVKHGHAKIIHIGMGGPTSSVADMGAIRAGVDAFGADKIYLVHNHPSGNLNPSEPDRRLVRALEIAFGSDIKTEGIIMDTTSGRYTTFDSLRRTETFDRPREESSTNTDHEVYRLNHADRSGMPENIVQIKSPQDVKTFLGNLRFGGVKKVSYLILSTNHEIIGHFHTGYTTLEDAGLAEEIASVAEKFGGTTVVVYGNMEITKSLGLKEALKNKSLNTITLLDVVGMRGGIHRSAIDEGLLREESEPYGSLTEVREPMTRETSPQNIGKIETENERLSAIRALKPIKIERNSMSREELFAIYKSLPTVNKDGNKIRFLRTAFGKNYKEGGLFAQISPRLNDVLSSAVLAYSEKDSLGGTTRPDGIKHKAHSNVLSFDNYVNKVSIENCEYYVRMTVQNTVDNTTGLHSCFVSDIDLYENTAIGRTDSAISRRPNDSFSGIVDAKLQQFFERASSVESKNSHGASEGENGASDEAPSQEHASGEADVADVSDEARISPEAKRSHAEKLAKKFNTPITTVDDVEKLPAAMRNKKGGYDVRNGNVIVVIPNHADVEDVAETVFHEVVAHKGLREMLGEENYDAFCDEIYGHLKDDLKRQIDTEAGRRFMREPEKGYEHHRRVAVDELFGRMAEKGFEDFTKAERGIWAKLKAKVLEAINKFLGSLKLPKWVRLGDNELRYILWRSHERLGARAKAQEQVQNEALDFVDMARDVAKRAELGLNKSDVIVTRSRKTTADRIEESFDAAVAGELTGKPVEIGRLTKEGREYLEKLSGLKLKDVVSFVLNPSDLAHIYRRHFGKNETDARNIPLTKDDIRQMAYVVSSPDKVIFGKEKSGNQRNMFFFLKETDNGSYNLMEVYSDRKGNLTAKSYFKSKEGVSQRAMLLNESSTLTSVTDGATLSDSAKLPKFFESATISEEESFDFRYRDGETGDIWKDQSIGLKEKITYAALRLSKAQADDLTLRNDAMAAIGDNLKNLLHDMRNRRGTTQRFAGADHKVEADIAKAKAAQLRYDRSTVKRVGDLARILMQTGYLSDMTSGEILRLMSAVKNSVGGNDIESSVDKIMDIMIGNQLRNAEDALHSLLSIRGSKVDSRGVEVQGELDIDGQRTIEVVKRTINLNEDNITSLMDDARDRMGDSDKIIADNAAIEYAGLNMALDYAQNIANSKAEEAALRYDLKTANEDMKVGRLTENAYKQLVDSIDEAIRKNKIERAEAYFNLVGRLSDSLRESIENAKAFRNAEKARVREIQHNANSDMEGRPSNEHHKDDWKDKMANNGFVQFVLAPLGTFDQILRTFGNKSANGEGYLWNRFMRGWVDCRNKELLGVKNKFARLDEKVAEIFGAFAKARGGSKKSPKVKSMADMIKLDGKLPTATVKFWDGGEMREHELTQGNLLYIYMVDKMTDGRMKLRRMGITEEDIANVEKALDPRFKEFGDWLQEEFLVDTRNEYNETHKRIFGASMAAVENYFPLKILSNARTDKEEDVNQQGRPDGITTKTGSIIKRRTNSLALDIIGSNALSVVLDHITEMEHWNAYAEWNRDLNTLRTYKRFRNQVMNMTTAYGGGERLWKRFNDLCLMGAGEYRPPIAMLDKAAVNIAKGVTAAKVSFRIFTALKQFLSAPAYIPEVSTASIAKSLTNPYGDFKWCMENLPIFYERWHSRISGDPRLLKTDHDWKTWREGIVAVAARLGMTPNAFVDALTVSIGARAMYQTRLKRYLKEGYASEEAENRAKQDATILFNQTQQSSESPFLSTMQVDRSWLSVLFTVFRNSSMSYTRQEYDALRNLKRNLTPGQRAKSIEFMTKQILRDWDIDPDTATDAKRSQAQSAAKKRFRRQLKKDVVRLATFGFILQLAWNLGAYLPYIIFGDDEDEKDKMWDDALTHAYFGSVEGLTGGDVMSSFGNMWASGEWNERQLTKDMPLASDISAIIKKFAGGKNIEAINDIVNLAVQSGIGVNPQSITDVVVAITDACGDDPRLSHEAAICIMRILQVPQSQLDKMYFDEVGLSGREISQYTPGQLAQRYAEYKIMRGTPFVPWMWGDEEQQSKYEKSAQKKIKERLAGREDDEVVATYEDLDDRYKSFTKKIGAVKEMMGTDYIAAAQEAAELQNDPDFKIYQKRNALDAALDKAMRKWPPQRRERVKDLRLEGAVAGVPQSKLAIKASEQKKVSLTGELNRIANKYFTAETPEEARLIADTMAKYRALIVDAMQTDSEAEQEAAISELSTLIHDFRTKEDEMRSTKR